MKKIYILYWLVVFVLAFTTFALTKDHFREKRSLAELYQGCIDREKKEVGQCLKELAEYLYGNYKITEVEAGIDTLDPEKLQKCHELMHYLGWVAYKKEKSLSETFLVASGKCDSGMYHGIIEEYINEAKVDYASKEFIDIITNACSFIESRESAIKSICHHGLGHALMFITENDLASSLDYCNHLENGWASSCFGGALMENIETKGVSNTGGHVKEFAYKADDPDYPCNVLKDDYKNYCYVYRGVFEASKGEFDQAFKKCLNISAGYQSRCFWGVGNNIPTPVWSSRTSGEKCDLALEVSHQAYEQCIHGAMNFLIQLNLGSASAAAEFCDAIQKEYKDLCYRRAGFEFGGWLRAEEELQSKCSIFPDIKAQSLCLNHDQS